MVSESLYITYCEINVTFSLSHNSRPWKSPCYKLPALQEGSCSASYQAMIQNANPPLQDRPRAAIQAEQNRTELQQRKDLRVIWSNTTQLMISYCIELVG